MLVDTHAHLDFPDFEPDRAAVVSRAQAAGVDRLITIGTDVASSRRGLDLATEFSGVHPAAGVHPCYVDDLQAGWLEELEKVVADPRVVAVGEMGLDYHHLPSAGPGGAGATEAGREQDRRHQARQREVFEAQLHLAEAHGLNVVIHQRDSWRDTLDVLRPFTGRLRAVFHCFGGTPEQAAEVVALGHFVSFTGIVTFKKAEAVRAAVAAVDERSYFLETDCPYLAPVPHRGRRCEPAFVRETAVVVAAARGQTLEEVAAATTRNAEFFFAFGRSGR